jgi:hypothetical protein
VRSSLHLDIQPNSNSNSECEVRLELLTLQCLPCIWSWTPDERTTPLTSNEDPARREVLKVSPRGLGSHMVTVRMRDNGELRGRVCKCTLSQSQLPMPWRE